MRKFKNLVVRRIALVDAGSNPDADIVFFKRDEPVAKADFKEVLTEAKFGEVVSEIVEMCQYLETAIITSLWSSEDRVGEIRRSIRQFSSAVDESLDGWLKGQIFERAQFKVATELTEELSARRAAVNKRVFPQQEDRHMKVDISTLSAEERKELLDALTTKAKEPTTEELARSLPPEVAERLTAQDAEVTTLRTKLVEVSKALDDERTTRENITLQQEIEKDYPNLPGTMEEKIKLLRLAKTDTAVMAVLKTANERVARLLSPVGDDTGGEVESGAFNKMKALTDAIIKAGDADTFEKALTLAAERNPKLYDEYVAEQGRKH